MIDPGFLPDPLEGLDFMLEPAKPKPLVVDTPSGGTFFDENLEFREPEGSRFTNDVLVCLADIELRQRKRRERDEANHRKIVGKILANGFRCFLYRDPAWVAYFRKAESYRDSPAWLSGKAISRTVDLLTRANLLQTQLGEYGRASTYQITQTLYEIGRRHDIGDNSLTFRLPPEKLVRLRSKRPHRAEINFAPSRETRKWIALLAAYNAFMAQQDITLGLSGAEEADWATKLNAHGGNGSGMPFYRPERFQTDLYRQFNNGTFEEGGRLYGGWWINIPKALRPRITINGLETIELDFAGHAVRMLYNERGIDYRDDPYEIAAIAELERRKGLNPGHFRKSIKSMTQALINDREGRYPERIQLPVGHRFSPHFKRRQVRDMIAEKHRAIADAFGTGAGLRLQRADSDLALDIIVRLKDRGIAALPIHDSFIAPIENKEQLEAEMKDSYNRKFLFDPIII